MTFPSESKDESREPSVLYLATANSLLDPLFEEPATTIFPLLSIAIELPKSLQDPNTVITFPSESKDVSRDPSLLYRINAKSLSDPLSEAPATTIFPSLCIATDLAKSSEPIAVVTIPSESKDESRDPSVLYLSTAISF